MNPSDVENFVKETGYKTLPEIKARFSADNQEILGAYLQNLVDKHKLRRVKYTHTEQENTLYVIPY